MNRWLAIAIAVIGGAVLGNLLLLVIGGAVLGFLWLYVLGDDPWPAWSDYVLGTAIVLGSFSAWAFCGWTLWWRLKPKF
ncbi:MAG: hypothetical protein ABIS23_00850 [Sphingomicrobium sp.]